jgi:L-amino acid N-acyltransferase YncA
MPTELTNKDYVSILKYYNLSIPKSKRLLQKQAEQIMATKLCKCIKKIDPENEAKSIGICTKTIFNSKGYTRGQFQCKKKQSVKFRKTQKNRTRRNK